MNILLVNPSQKGVYGKMNSPDYPPMGLAYIGAVLEKAGYSVKIIDMDADNLSDEDFINISKNYNVVGITATTPTFESAEKLFQLVKVNTQAITILGGIHATIAPQECIKSNFIDFVVKGEGEETILELVNALKNKKSFNKIKGIFFKKAGKIINNPPRDLIKDLDTIPFPARHLFDHQKYTYPDSLRSPVMPIMTSRGCPHGCTYCCTKLIFTRKVRFRSAKNVVDEIEFLIKNYGVKEIHFWDDNFTLNKPRVFEIRDELKRRKINLKFAFPNGLRVDQVDEDILRCLKDMGVYSMAFGVESGNQIILDNVKKGTKIEQIEKAYTLAKNLGFETWGFFMLGLPGETPETIRNTINFAKKINPDIAKFHILKPFPGTEVFNELKSQGLITNFNYSNYGIHTRPVHRLPQLSEDDLLNWSKIAYREFYLNPSKIFRQVLRLRSFERIKMNVKTATLLLKSMK
jgi:radical SAM superfamily enzyme YgiQ (UPF0313 family)